MWWIILHVNLTRLGLIPGLGRSPAEGIDNQLQYSCLENPMDRGGWQTVVHRVRQDWATFIFTFTLTGSQTLGNHYFWVCLWRCFWMKLAFELVELVNEFVSPVWVGIIQSIKGLSTAKRWRKDKFGPLCLITELRHPFSALVLLVLIIFTPVSEVFALRLNHTTGIPRSISWPLVYHETSQSL